MSLKIHLIPDKWHLRNIGLLESGARYWIDTQLVHENGSTRDFVASYVFDEDGNLIQHEIVDLGPRSSLSFWFERKAIAAQRKKLGKTKKADIWVRPFSVEAHSHSFGLVLRPVDENDDKDPDMEPVIDALPGYTIMFYPPWEEGGYDT